MTSATCYSHETSTVSGASVVGMTTWVGQRQDDLPASILTNDWPMGPAWHSGLATWAFGQGSLCCWHEPASIKLLLTTYFIKVYRYQTKAPETKDQGDASHGAVTTHRPNKAASNGRIREGARHISRICQIAGGQVYFIKWPAPRRRSRWGGAQCYNIATTKLAAGQPDRLCNQAPAYIRGPGPLA
jgi:hypothetical protein